jgi:DNA-binding NarL/FixJ family response regulator
VSPLGGAAIPPLRVLIADDHQLFAETLSLSLDFDERVEVAGSARDGKEAVRLALDLQPDAVLMDLEMPVLDGFNATRLLRRLLPACPVVVLTASPSSEDVRRARSAGAAAYLNKGCSADHVVAALLEAETCVSSPADDTESEAAKLHQLAQP